MAHKRNKAGNSSLSSGNGDEKEGNSEVSLCNGGLTKPGDEQLSHLIDENAISWP
jgi:hypothetical protein